ncbi:MAG: class I SAM-dependent methyltransferase [Spirochaetota bacterium]
MTMYEIYERDAAGYDALVAAEDHAGNLCRALREIVVWTDALVVEAGIGTGRVTRCYIDAARTVHGFDRSTHMLARAAENLGVLAPGGDAGSDGDAIAGGDATSRRDADGSASGRVHLAVAEHRSLPVADGTADIVVEGWAFGHAITDAAEGALREQEQGARDAAVASAITTTTNELIAEARRVLRPGGSMIIIETLGTNVGSPRAPLPSLARFYRELEERYGFTRVTIRTDYRFNSAEEAAERCGFFFGSEMGRAVAASGSATVPEFTGIWWARLV